MPETKKPQSSILRKVFGDPLSQKNAEEWPELAGSWAGRQVEMPVESAAVNKLRPFNFIERAIAPDVSGITYPWGTVAMNKNAIANSGVDINETLAHELVHAGQNTVSGLLKKLYNAPFDAFKPYEQKSQEKEAFEAGYKRPIRRFDIDLKAPKPAPIQAAYNTGKKLPGTDY